MFISRSESNRSNPENTGLNLGPFPSSEHDRGLNLLARKFARSSNLPSATFSRFRTLVCESSGQSNFSRFVEFAHPRRRNGLTPSMHQPQFRLRPHLPSPAKSHNATMCGSPQCHHVRLTLPLHAVAWLGSWRCMPPIKSRLRMPSR